MPANKFSRLHILYSLLIAGTAFLLCGIVLFFVNWSLGNIDNNFKVDAGYARNHIRDQLAQNETVLIGLGSFLNAAPVDITAVKIYTEVMLQRFPHISMFQIAQYIDATPASAYQHIMLQHGIHKPGIFQFGGVELLLDSPAVLGTLPVIFVAPTTTKDVLGLDLSSIDFIRQALPERARSELAISEPIELFDGEKALVMMLAIPANQSHSETYLALILIKQYMLFPKQGIAKDWNISITVTPPQGNSFLVGTMSSPLSQHKTGYFLHRVTVSDDIQFSNYKMNVQLSKNITWLDLNLWKLSLLVFMVLAILSFLCVIYLMHVSVEFQREKNQKILFKQANYDLLTNLPNRYYFENSARLVLANAERQALGVLLLFVDLNGFKTINDNLGHDAGDKVLQAVGGALNSVLREGDLVARLGGDEFVVLINAVKDLTVVLHVIEKVRHILEVLSVEGVPTDSVSGSIGFSYTLQHGYELQNLLKIADNSMYGEKHYHHKRYSAN